LVEKKGKYNHTCNEKICKNIIFLPLFDFRDKKAWKKEVTRGK